MTDESTETTRARDADAAAAGAHVIGVVNVPGVPKLETGIPGFDHVTMGGLPKGRATLVVGPAGSAKTVFAGQFLAEGVLRGQSGVFVSFEESADDLRANLATLGWPVQEWEEAGHWRFVDASPVPGTEQVELGAYNFDGLVARIGHAVDHVAADRIAIDSIGSVFTQFADPTLVRMQLHRLAAELRRMGTTIVITAENASPSSGTLSRHGVEEYVADNVVIMRNDLEDEKRRRTIEVLKLRGAMHRKGEYPFTVLPGQGIVVIPLSVMSLDQTSSDARLTTGNEQLDLMTNGGFFRDAIVLASGATGTGKTLMVTEFMSAGCDAGERCLFFAYEESRDQIFRNARGWGRDFESYERSGLLRLVATYPEVASLEDHLVEVKNMIDAFQPTRVAIDSLSALERIGTVKGFREFIIGLTSFVKAQNVAALFTATTPALLGGTSITEGHISTLTDAIVLLRYAEIHGEVRRGLTVLKMRGSSHDREIREFRIDGKGMHIGDPFRSVSGILTGRVTNASGEPVSHFTDVVE